MYEQLKGFRPMLSAKIDTASEETVMRDLKKLSYPLIGSPKVDGIRVCIHPELGPVTRTLKAVPNIFIYNILSDIDLHFMDGEITVGDITAPDLFNRTQSAVMTRDGAVEFQYWTFDDFTSPNNEYKHRHSQLFNRILTGSGKPSYIQVLDYVELRKPEEVLEWEEKYLEKGYEGIMLRHPHCGYKFNRATLKGQQLIKMKRRADLEGKIIGYTPLERNQNEQQRDAFGLAKRSSHQANLVADDLLGTLVLDPLPGSGFTEAFSVGSGFDVNQRTDLWSRRDSLIGQVVTVKYMAVGSKDKPRHPIFKGFRPELAA